MAKITTTQRVPMRVAPEVRTRLKHWLLQDGTKRGYSQFIEDALDREGAPSMAEIESLREAIEAGGGEG